MGEGGEERKERGGRRERWREDKGGDGGGRIREEMGEGIERGGRGR